MATPTEIKKERPYLNEKRIEKITELINTIENNKTPTQKEIKQTVENSYITLRQ